MLILIEHDSILSTPEARQSLAAFVAHRPNINVAVFHSAKLSAAEVCDAYPPELRKRLPSLVISEQLEKIVARTLAKKRNDRFPAMRDLEQVLVNELEELGG